MILTYEEYLEEEDLHSGYCTECDDLTHDCCEPDAQGYECPVCGENSVYGLAEALLMGFIDIS